MTTTPHAHPVTSRELRPGIFWLGDCLEQFHMGRTMHSYNSCFLVVGSEASLLVDTGHPKDFELIRGQLETLLAGGRAPLKYVFVTHQETPHAGNLGRVLRLYPGATACGEMSDYHLAFPEFADRMVPMVEGERIELGNRTFITVAPIVRDLRTTLWGFDTLEKTLFPADGFAYGHFHDAGHCGKLAEEAQSLDIRKGAAVFAERALFWTKFCDVEPYIARLRQLIADLDVQFAAPAHGLPIADLPLTMPKVEDGLRDEDGLEVGQGL